MRWPMPRLALGLPEKFSNLSHILLRSPLLQIKDTDLFTANTSSLQ